MTASNRSAAARPRTAIGSGRVRSRQLIAILATAVAYLVWRVGWTLGSSSPWFSIALLLLEVWAIGQLVVTAAVLRRGRQVPEPAIDLSNAVPAAHDIAVVIDAATASPDALRRTLVSMGETATASSFVVILAEDDRVAASSIARAGGTIRVDASPDRNAAFWAAAVAEERPFALWIEAGDVITPSTLTRLAEHFVDVDVAVVQGSIGLINADSFLHLREGHDEAAYERDVLLPALGSVGAAPWGGSGSMCRVEAIAGIGGLEEGPGSREAAVARLHQQHLTTRHEAQPVIRRTAPDTIGDYLHERQNQARDRLRLRAMAPRRPNLLARLALADTHLRSIRQLFATWLLVVALVVAPEPVSGSVPLWIAAAVVVHGLCAWARHSVAAGTMGWGDWVRQGWRTVGADLAGAVNRRPRSAAGGSASGVKTLGRLRLATFTLVAIDLAVLARAATLIDPDLLPRFGTASRFAALGAALLCIVALVDVMQVVVRRRQRRADTRIAVPLSAIVDEDYCETSDLSPSGVGLVLAEARDVGSPITMTLAVPRLDGSVAAVDLDGTVRHTRPFADDADEDGVDRHVVGVEFGEVNPEAWSALFTYCAIVHPAGLDRRIDPEPIIGPATLDIRHSRLQKVMGPVSVMAGVLAAGTMFFGPGAGAAFASSSVGEARACVLSPDGSGHAGGLVQMHFDGVWNDIATTDESGCVALAVPRAGAVPVQVVLEGRTKRIDQDLLWDPSVVFETTEVVVEVVSSSGEPVEAARVQRWGGSWIESGRTGADGTVRFETWDQTIPVQVVLDGRTKRIDQNVRWDPRVVFETTEVVVEVASSSGEPVSGAQVQWHGGMWREAGATGVDGTVRFETWDQTIPVQVVLDGRTKRIDRNVQWDPRVVFETTEVVVEVVSSTGEPVESARVQWHGGMWREAGATGVDGTVRFETWDQTIPVQVWLNGRVHRIDQNAGVDPTLVFETSEVVVEVMSSTGEPVSGARVQWHGGTWREAGGTGTDGEVRFETWPQTIPVQVVLDGRTKRIDQNVRWDPRVVFETTEVVVEVASSTGEPVSGAQVQWHGGMWREAGATDVDGTVRFETWDQTIPVQVWLNGRVHRIDQNVGIDATVAFETTEAVVEVASSTGAPIEGAVVEWHGGVWRRAGRTGADGTVRFETWAQTIPVQVTLNARIQRKDQNIARTPLFAFETVPLPDELVDDTVQYHNGQWRIFRAGEEFLPGALLLQRADSSTHTVTLVAPRPEPEPEPTPTPLPEPTAEPTTQPDSIAEPTPLPGSGTETSQAETPEPVAEPTATAGAGSAPLVLDLPDPEPTAAGGSENGSPPSTDAAPPPSDTVPPPADTIPPPVESVPPSFDTAPPPPADGSGPDAPGAEDDGLVVIIRPIAPSAETAETDIVSFDLEVTNQGTRRAEAPVVVDVDLGSAITPTTVDSDAWRCSHESGRLRCVSADPIDPGSRTTIAVTGQSPDGAAPTDLAMAAESSAVSVTTGDELGAPAAADPAAVAGAAPTVRVVVDGRTSPMDTLTLVLLLAIAVGVWSGRLRRRKPVT